MSEDPTMPDLHANTAAAGSITPELLLQKLRSDVPLTLVDVRDRADLDRASIAGSRCFPLRHLTGRLPELFGARSTPIVLISRTGSRARTAATIMCFAGFQDVVVLEGGLENWKRLGYPVTIAPRAREASP